MNFSGSRSFLRKQVRKIGFRWRRCQNKRKLLIEKYNIVDLRCAYLRRIKAYREQGLNLVYIDETWIDTSNTVKYCWQSDKEPGVYQSISKGERLVIVHAGGKKGFVPNALEVWNAKSNKGDYHNEMNGEMFLKWYTEKLLANLQEKSVIIMDNASYHSMQSEKNPTSSSRKADIQNWLRSHNIEFDNDMLRPQLLALAKAHKPPPKYVIDTLTRENGHEVLRLPPYHPDLNPIELIWSHAKYVVASRNNTGKVDDVIGITKQVFTEINVQEWVKDCEHVFKIEEDYRKKDIVVDEEIEQFIINVTDDDSSNSNNDSGSETEDYEYSGSVPGDNI